MNEYDIKRFALILSVQAEIEGMKIYNLKYPDTTGYGQENFDAMAEQLRIIASKHNEQL